MRETFKNPRIFQQRMGIYKAIQTLWKKPKESIKVLQKERLIEWRRENAITKINRPTRLDKARELGYKAKRGIVVARVRVSRGGRKREQLKKGRRSKTQRRKKIVGKNYQWICEERAQKHFTNLEILNSYYVNKDGLFIWYEVIMVDPHRPEIKTDKDLGWLKFRKHTNRVLRGKTSAGRKSRGLRNKGQGAEKIRPSRRANSRKSK